jgi:hypothetical protein
MASASKAFVRESVYYNGVDGCPHAAPFGEYEIARDDEDLVSFTHEETKSAFTLSLDALIQHICEGRISLIGGAALPPCAVHPRAR